MVPGLWKYENSCVVSCASLLHTVRTTEFVEKEDYLVVVSVQKDIVVLTRVTQTEAVSYKMPINKCRL